MSSETIYYLGETNRAISQTTGFDWTGNSAKAVIVVKPSGETISLSGSDVIVDDAVTGQYHIILTSSFDETGEYLMQAKVTISSAVYFGPIQSFIVEAVLVAAA